MLKSHPSSGYDAYMGRWSERLAPLFLDFAGVFPDERVNVYAVSAIDYEEQFVEALRQRNTDPRIEAQQGDACALPFAAGQFDRGLSSWSFISWPTRNAGRGDVPGCLAGRRRRRRGLGQLRRNARPLPFLGYVLGNRRRSQASSRTLLPTPASSTSPRQC